MRVLLLLAALEAFPAYADLYRWIDRDTGSVKFSSYPPPWFGDPAREPYSPPVEVIRHQGPAPSAAAAKPPAQEAANLDTVRRGLQAQPSLQFSLKPPPAQ